jgi:nitrite reductase/ring-hydroxylating ferredoxin subunit
MTFRRVSISTRIFSRRSSVVTWINRRPVLLAKVGDRIWAMDAVYAHLGCALLTEVNGAQATCPAHEAVWDIRTGALVAEPKIKPELPCEEEGLRAPLRTYPAREVDGFVEVDI